MLTSKIILSVVADLAFDWRYGTNTIRQTELDALNVSSPNEVHAFPYQATKARPFRRLMKALELPRDGTFVDLGSGKGRVLLLAVQAGFVKVRGIEFSSELCEIARRNVELFTSKSGTSGNVEILNRDVATYQIRDDETIFFMYNPFGPVVIDAFLRNLQASLACASRDLWLIYCIPKHDRTISDYGIFTRSMGCEFGGTEFIVYHSTR